jgi:hypothetical protein
MMIGISATSYVIQNDTTHLKHSGVETIVLNTDKVTQNRYHNNYI